MKILIQFNSKPSCHVSPVQELKNQDVAGMPTNRNVSNARVVTGVMA